MDTATPVKSAAEVPAPQIPDRRVHQRLRTVFDAAFELVEPFFDTGKSWGGVTLEHFAFRVLRENYPDLSANEVYVFITAARRIYAENRAVARAKTR